VGRRRWARAPGSSRAGAAVPTWDVPQRFVPRVSSGSAAANALRKSKAEESGV